MILSKNNYCLYIYLYYLLSAAFMVVYLFNYQSVYTFEWVLFNSYDVNISISLNYTIYNVIFMFTVCTVFSSVYHYSLFYMSGELGVKRFLLVLTLFVLSMMTLICSGNLFTSLIGWDGLGVSSMLLIMYYSSNASLKASMYTFVINRLGDCFFLVFIFLMVCQFPSLNATNYSVKGSLVLGMFLILMSMTKSSQTPFSSWLTKAMEAPTPVSSLVHSSTLVTAGIYMLFLYRDLWKDIGEISSLLCVISLTTLFLASIAGLLEMDLKKIVAYSTLSQLGFIVFVFSFSLFEQGFFHLIMHAFFKAMMFMSAGYVIHNSSGWQDIRLMTLNGKCSPGVVKILVAAVMSLCGMPFLSGFYSKDLIVDSVMSMHCSLLLLTMLYSSFIFTTFYSIRVCWFLVKGLKHTSLTSDDDLGMLGSMIYLYFCSCAMGSTMIWTFNIGPLMSVDSPKIILVFTLVTLMLVFWVLPSQKSESFFMKTNMYLYVVINIIVYNFMYHASKIYWSLDLVGVIGKVIKMPSYIIGKCDKVVGNYYPMIYGFKEFVLFLVLVTLVSMMLN
uniref:NADH dehydrogenase subunit 5 n=1 Tax=Franciscoloa funerei TaxID=2965269 RepID=UPI0025796A5A|nr:NADH dehydrogenase subunit 5 [Franciscoloa funerei]WGU50372.1 NADH dehydrogenase subunit 5 [Franciscoloa funerei]